MKTEQPELKVVVHGELDITKMPKDILDAFADDIIEKIENMMAENELRNGVFSILHNYFL